MDYFFVFPYSVSGITSKLPFRLLKQELSRKDTRDLPAIYVRNAKFLVSPANRKYYYLISKDRENKISVGKSCVSFFYAICLLSRGGGNLLHLSEWYDKS